MILFLNFRDTIKSTAQQEITQRQENKMLARFVFQYSFITELVYMASFSAGEELASSLPFAFWNYDPFIEVFCMTIENPSG